MKDIINPIVKKVTDNNKLFLIDIVIRGSKKNPFFEVFIDNSKGINADICAKISREIKDELEQTKFSETDYRLVVSSPGIDKPLLYLEQYNKHINRELKISYEEEDKIKSIEAKLLNIKGNELTFLYKKEELKIEFNKIKKAKVKFSF